jgi:hypothetical protein
MLLRASFRHDVLHNSVAYLVLSGKYQVMASTNASIIFKAKRKHVLRSQFADAFAHRLDDGWFSFPRWQTCKSFPQPLSALRPKQSVHMLSHYLIAQSGIDAVVVEEEYAVTPQFLRNEPIRSRDNPL